MGDGHDAQRGRVVAPPVPGAGTRWAITPQVDSGAGRRSQLIHGLVVDPATVIGALMPVEVVLIATAKLEQVVPFQHADIVTKHLVMAIPKACPRLLRIHVVGAQVLEFRLTQWFKRSSQPGKLYRISRPVPGPPIAQVAVVEGIGGVGADVGGQSEYVVPRQLRSHRPGSWDSQRIAGEKAPNIHLVSGGDGQFKVSAARREVPLIAKVVIDAENFEVAGLWQGQVRLVATDVSYATDHIATG